MSRIRELFSVTMLGLSVSVLGEEPPRPVPVQPPQAPVAAAVRRPQPQSGPYSWSTGDYQYDGAGNIVRIGGQCFGYDQRSRLTYSKVTAPDGSANESSFEYDPYGNMTKGACGTSTNIGVDAATNRLSGATYDGAGNVTQWQPPCSAHTYRFTYDGLNMATEERIDNETSPHLTYVYTADDERIAVEDRSTNGVAHWKIRGLDRQVLRDYQVSGTTWSIFRDYVYRGGALLAAVTPATIENFSLDHVGTPRLLTDGSGNKISFHTYLPFGEELGAAVQEGESRKFTGHERDIDPAGTTNALDYMHARYYASNPGRFLSVDPFISKLTTRNPQLWNRYTYVGNNPMSHVDPDGRLLQLSACKDSQTSDACRSQYKLYLSTFGNNAQNASKYLQLGKDGIVGFKNTTAQGFATRFGDIGIASAFLISNKTATFEIFSRQTEGGANFNARGGGGDINVDPRAFPRMLQGVEVSETEALAHEIGHAVSTLIPGYAEGVNAAAATSMLTGFFPRGEAYATTFENAWRRQTFFGPNVPIRRGYFEVGDVRDLGAGVKLFP